VTARTLGWVALLAAMWSWGGAFLPHQAAAAALAAAVLAALTLTADGAPADRGEQLLLVWIAWSAAGLLVLRLDPMDGTERIATWLIAVAALAAARRLPRSAGEPIILCAAAVAAAVAVLGEWYGFGVPRVAGVFDNPNVLAMLLVPMVPTVLSWPSPPWLRTAVVLLLVAGTVATGSRAGILALAVAGFVQAPRRLRRLWPLVLVAGAGVLAWRLTVWHDPLAWRRTAIWGAAGRLVVHSPLVGASPGGFDEAILPYRPAEPGVVGRWTKRPGNGESTPVQLAAETGIPGLLLVLGAVAALLRRRDHDTLPPGGQAVLAAMAVFSLVHDVLGLPVVLWSWAWLAGRALPMAASDEEAPPARGALRGAAAFSLLLLLVWALAAPEAARALLARPGDNPQPEVVARLAPLWAEPHFLEARRLLDGASWGWDEAARAVGAAEDGVRLHSGSPRAWRILAECLARAVRGLGPVAGTVDRAENAFRRATTLDPHNPWTWLGWARLERNLGRLERAEALARRAVAEEPSLVPGWLLAGRIALDRGRVEAARSALDGARAARDRARGHLLGRYERNLLLAPRWQLRQLEEQIP